MQRARAAGMCSRVKRASEGRGKRVLFAACVRACVRATTTSVSPERELQLQLRLPIRMLECPTAILYVSFVFCCCYFWFGVFYFFVVVRARLSRTSCCALLSGGVGGTSRPRWLCLIWCGALMPRALRVRACATRRVAVLRASIRNTCHYVMSVSCFVLCARKQ